MPVCVAGMHGAGTSLVGRLLSNCGVDMGLQGESVPTIPSSSQASANGSRFVAINEELLDALGGSWDAPPPLDIGWTNRPELTRLRERVRSLANDLALSEPWGWTDPANALTLAFWKDIFGELRVVACLRHPLEVADSLKGRCGMSPRLSLGLWCAYYSALLGAEEAPVTTDHRSYFDDPQVEIERLTTALRLRPGANSIRRAISEINMKQRHHVAGDDAAVPPEASEIYATLTAFTSTRRPQPSARAKQIGRAQESEVPEVTGFPQTIALQRQEIRQVREELAWERGRVDALQSQLELKSLRDEELRNAVESLHVQLIERDEEIENLRAETDWRRSTEEALLRELEWRRNAVVELEQELEKMKATRAWRWAERFRSMKRLPSAMRGRIQS